MDKYFPMRIGGKTLQLQLAVSEKEKNLGLMHRKKLPEDHGMLFLYEKPGRKSFWMKWLKMIQFIFLIKVHIKKLEIEFMNY